MLFMGIFAPVMDFFRYLLILGLAVGMGVLLLGVVPQRIDEEMTFLQSCDRVRAWVEDPERWSRWWEDLEGVHRSEDGRYEATIAGSGQVVRIEKVESRDKIVRYTVERENERITYFWRFGEEGNHCVVEVLMEIRSNTLRGQLALAWNRKERKEHLEEQLTTLQRVLYEQPVLPQKK